MKLIPFLGKGKKYSLLTLILTIFFVSLLFTGAYSAHAEEVTREEQIRLLDNNIWLLEQKLGEIN